MFRLPGPLQRQGNSPFLFLAARTILNDVLQRKAGKVVGRIRTGFQRSAWSYMLFLRLSPIFPFWCR